MADSPSASYTPTCHPGTREVVSTDIMTWARDPKATPILWLSGPAGAGKSCIQRKIVQLCTDEGLYVACFFFSVKESETSSETRFIATLAAQLAENIPGLKWYIERAIKRDHRIFTKSLDLQAEGLIIRPLQALEDSMSNRLERLWRKTLTTFASQGDPKTRVGVIVIDGLDECADEKEQAHILHLVNVLANHSVFPFRFVIASRPEYAIRTAFSSPSLSAHTRVLRLERYEADGDIRRFMKAEFCRLRSNHPASKAIPVDWPSAKDETALVIKSSGQFVFISTVMKHLSNPRRNPVLELQHILDYRPSESNTNPFAELDALYNRILCQPGIDIRLLKSILHAIIRSIVPFKSTEEIDAILDLAPGHYQSCWPQDFLTGRPDAFQGRFFLYLAMSHSCCVREWSLFDTESIRHAIPSLTEEWFIQLFLSIGKPPSTSDIPFHKALRLFFVKYHSFHCTSRDSCFRQCKRLRFIHKTIRVTGEESEVVDEEFWLGVSLESDQTIKRKMVEDWLNEADSIGDYSPPA
ncbi:hypothetical protein H1R20_g12235, partial [Candolleomyces eurysporus]